MSVLLELWKQFTTSQELAPSSASAIAQPFSFPDISEAITQFINAPWEAREPPPMLIRLVGEIHINRFKEVGAAAKAQYVWRDIHERIELARRLKDSKGLEKLEQNLLKCQLLPLAKAPGPFARDCEFSRDLFPDKQEGFKTLCQILSGEKPFPESRQEALRLELFLLRRMALITLTKERGDLLVYTWLDLLRSYKTLGPEAEKEANRVLKQLKLAGEAYDRFFIQQVVPREGASVPKATLAVVTNTTAFPHFVNDLRISALSYFSLKFVVQGLALFHRYLFEATDEDEQTTVLYFFAEVEKLIGKNCIDPDYTIHWNPLLDKLQRIFDPKSRLKNFLESVLLYTAVHHILEKKKYVSLDEKCLEPFFLTCLQLSLEDRKKILEKLLSLDPCTNLSLVHFKAEFFLTLSQRQWLTPFQLLWVFLHDLELCHTAQKKGDTLNNFEVVELIENINQFLGIPLASEFVWALFSGVPLKFEAKIAVSNLKNWRREIKEEVREFFPSVLHEDLPRRREELNSAFADKTPFQSLKKDLIELLWFSTYLSPLYLEEFKHIPLRLENGDWMIKQNFDPIRKPTIYPPGAWHQATTQLGQGPHLRASWKNLTPHKKSGGVYRFEWIYADLKSQQTLSESFLLEIEEKQGCDLMTGELFRSILCDSIAQKNRESEFVVGIYKSLYPSQYDKLNNFLKQINISLRNMPARMAEPFPEFKDQPLDFFINQRRTFPIFDQKVISILPPSHPLALDPSYCIFREHYTGFAETLIQHMKNLFQTETKMVFANKEIPVAIDVVEQSSSDESFFFLTASTTLNDVRYEDKTDFPSSCSDALKMEMILGLISQFKGMLCRDLINANDGAARHFQSQKESSTP